MPNIDGITGSLFNVAPGAIIHVASTENNPEYSGPVVLAYRTLPVGTYEATVWPRIHYATLVVNATNSTAIFDEIC